MNHLVPNVRILPKIYEFEVWWILPELVDMNHVNQFKSTLDSVYWKEYFYGITL